MPVDLFFNDLSANPVASTREIAKSWMLDLITVARRAIKSGAANSLRTKTEFVQVSLAVGYRVADWRGDHTVDEVQRDYMRTLATRGLLINDEQIRIDIEYKYNNQAADALGLAYYFDGLTLSFPASVEWTRAEVELEEFTLTEAGDIVSRKVRMVPA
jgi:hypothetical protein